MFVIPEPESSAKMETIPYREPSKRQANVEAVFIPTTGSEEELARATYLSSLADPSTCGKLLAKAAIKKIGLIKCPNHMNLVSASPASDLSGVDLSNSKIREGTLESIEKWVRKLGGHIPCQVHKVVKQIVSNGDNAIVIASEKIVLGVVILKVARTI